MDYKAMNRGGNDGEELWNKAMNRGGNDGEEVGNKGML